MSNEAPIPYEEHEKLKKQKEFHSHVCEFVEWLESQGYEFCKVDTSRQSLTIVPYLSFKPDKIIAEFFEIDAQKLEEEKRQMIEEMRGQN